MFRRDATLHLQRLDIPPWSVATPSSTWLHTTTQEEDGRALFPRLVGSLLFSHQMIPCSSIVCFISSTSIGAYGEHLPALSSRGLCVAFRACCAIFAKASGAGDSQSDSVDPPFQSNTTGPEQRPSWDIPACTDQGTPYMPIGFPSQCI